MQRVVCWPTAIRAMADRKYDALREAAPFHDGTFKSWRKKRSDSHPFHFRDGVTIQVSEIDLTPDDHFLEDGSYSLDDDSSPRPT